MIPAPHRCVVMLKAPRAGAVKTRLAAALGAERARAAYVEMLDVLFARLAPLESLELRFTPDDAAVELEPWRQAHWTLVPQGAGDLGGRLARTFADHFTAGAERIVVIGSDCPEVSAADIAEAWTALRSHDAVLGPAADGGYWLIGLRRPAPELFKAIPWSTADVYELTARRAREAGLSLARLSLRRDVDTLADWKAWMARDR